MPPRARQPREVLGETVAWGLPRGGQSIHYPDERRDRGTRQFHRIKGIVARVRQPVSDADRTCVDAPRIQRELRRDGSVAAGQRLRQTPQYCAAGPFTPALIGARFSICRVELPSAVITNCRSFPPKAGSRSLTAALSRVIGHDLRARGPRLRGGKRVEMGVSA